MTGFSSTVGFAPIRPDIFNIDRPLIRQVRPNVLLPNSEKSFQNPMDSTGARCKDVVQTVPTPEPLLSKTHRNLSKPEVTNVSVAWLPLFVPSIRA